MSAVNTGWSKGPCVRTELILQHRLVVAVEWGGTGGVGLNICPTCSSLGLSLPVCMTQYRR